jgi:hypothetical protein
VAAHVTSDLDKVFAHDPSHGGYRDVGLEERGRRVSIGLAGRGGSMGGGGGMGASPEAGARV